MKEKKIRGSQSCPLDTNISAPAPPDLEWPHASLVANYKDLCIWLKEGQ